MPPSKNLREFTRRGKSRRNSPRTITHLWAGFNRAESAWTQQIQTSVVLGDESASGTPRAPQAPGARRFEIAFATVTNWGNSVIPLDRRGQTVETIESLGNTGVRPVRSSPCLGFQVPLRWYGCDAQRACPSRQNYYHSTSYFRRT